MDQNNPANNSQSAVSTFLNTADSLNAFFTHIPDVYWEYSLTEDKFLFISPSVYQLRGYTPEEALKHSFKESVHPDDYLYISTHLGPRINKYESGTESLKILYNELRQPHKNGGMVWVEVVTSLVMNQQGKVDRILGVSRDISYRKKDQQLFRDTRSLFDTVFNHTFAGIALSRSDGTFINVNQGFCKMLGYPKEYVLQQNFFSFIDPQDEQEARQLMNPHGNISEDKQCEVRFLNLHKQVIWGLINLTGVQFIDGNVQWVLQVQETTSRKNTEEIIKNLNKNLQVKNTEMEQLVYITSHDLRSPMVNIKGFSNELRHSYSVITERLKLLNEDALLSEIDAFEKSIDESFNYIDISITRMDKLLKGLLEYSRLGRKANLVTRLDMNDILREVVRNFEFTIKQNRLNVQINTLPPCLANEDLINQAFSNIVGNAIKYMDPAREGTISISGETSGSYVYYSVKDNGIGIDFRHHNKIFDLFYRLKPDMNEGEGLGLSVVKKIVELSGGNITLESEPDKGSCFTIALPRPE